MKQDTSPVAFGARFEQVEQRQSEGMNERDKSVILNLPSGLNVHLGKSTDENIFSTNPNARSSRFAGKLRRCYGGKAESGV